MTTKSCIFFCFLTIFGIKLSQGQIILQRGDLPIINDTVRITLTDISGVDYISSGADYSWDFSQIKSKNEEVMEYKSSLQTDYKLYFLGLNYFGLKGEDITIGGYGLKDIYNFFEIDNSKYGVKGIGVKFQDAALATVYNKLDKIFSLPLKFNQKDSNEYAFKIEIPNLGAYKGSGTRVTVVDGWGEVNTPYGMFSCLRTKSVVNGTDSISGSILGFPIAFGIPVSKVEYQWWAKGQKVPVFSVEGRMVGNNFVPTKTYYKGTKKIISTSIQDFNSDNSFKIISLGSKTIKVEVPEVYLGGKLAIYSTNGQLIKSVSIQHLSQENILDTYFGIHIAILELGEKRLSQKIWIN
ncbi:MAG: hypothetical protein M9958_10270 [Chitinophagales bacterium]|nr:hypothetical protein [Chitinophagales bacterium]